VCYAAAAQPCTDSYRGYTVRYTARGQKRLQKFLMGSPQQQQKRNGGPSPPRRWQFRRPVSKLFQCIVVQCLLLLLMVLPWLVGCCPDLLLCCLCCCHVAACTGLGSVSSWSLLLSPNHPSNHLVPLYPNNYPAKLHSPGGPVVPPIRVPQQPASFTAPVLGPLSPVTPCLPAPIPIQASLLKWMVVESKPYAVESLHLLLHPTGRSPISWVAPSTCPILLHLSQTVLGWSVHQQSS
jgi:hypothetical protein